MKIFRLLIILSIYSAFLINGLQSQNLNLIITGSNNNETSIIDSIGYTNSFVNFKLLEEEILKLRENILQLGFIENEIVTTEKENDSTYRSKIRLGKKYYTIYIYYNKNVISTHYIKSITEYANDSYFKVDFNTVEAILSEINSHLIEKGYPFSSVKLDYLKNPIGNLDLSAQLIIEHNKPRTINEVVIKGYNNFPKQYIKHFLKIKLNDILELNTLKEKAKVLNSLPFVNQSRDPEILFTKDSTKVFFYLEKSKSNLFDGYLGFGTNETSGKIEFDGYLDLTLINNFNYGESINLVYKSDESKQKTFNLNLKAPYIFNSPIGIELGLRIFKKDSTFTTINQSVNLFYQINNQQALSGGLITSQSNNLLSNSSTINIEDYNALFYTLQYQIRKPQLDNLLFPNNFSFSSKVGLGNRKNEGNQENQSIYEVNTYKIFNFNTKNNVFLRIKLQGIHSENYFANELLRFGGINSIRGFEENSLLATSYGFINLEYRYNLSPSIYVHTITDAAYLSNNQENFNKRLYSFGFGLGVLTKAGLLKLNYANGKSEEQIFKLSTSKIHLSLTAKF